MSKLTYQPRGLYFEEFEIGQEIVTASRTITEADIVNFAGLSGDFNAIHTDAVFAAQGAFGRRVAHGLLVQSIAVGLVVQSGVIEGTVLAFRELTTKFSLPIYIGDTIHVRATVKQTKAFRRLGGGNVTIKYGVINHEGKIAQRGDWIMLIKSKE
ncbi:MAG: dehydratase [Chloroflexi bacterium]|nr:dehydratase [Chloroflexota bacterium]